MVGYSTDQALYGEGWPSRACPFRSNLHGMLRHSGTMATSAASVDLLELLFSKFWNTV